MNKSAKIMIAIATFMAIALIVWAVRTVPEWPKTETATTDTEKTNVMSYTGNTLREEKDGRVIWEIYAEETEINVETKDTKMKGIRGFFIADDGNKMEVKAGKGKYNQANASLEITDGVSLTTDDGANLNADTLIWETEGKKISAVGNAKIKRGDIEGFAEKIESTNGFKVFKMTGNAHIVKGAE